MVRRAWAIWRGGLRDGSGTISTESGALKALPYGYKSRFENGPGTNPEELIAAAHAGCFSMALSLMLGQAGFTPENLETHAEVTLERVGEGFEITASHLSLSANVPGVDSAKFMELANAAKAGCPVSKLMKANIKLDAKLQAQK